MRLGRARSQKAPEEAEVAYQVVLGSVEADSQHLVLGALELTALTSAAPGAQLVIEKMGHHLNKLNRAFND